MRDPADPLCDAVFNNYKNKDSHYRTDEEKVIIKVRDGDNLSVKCTGYVSDPRCVLKTSELDLGEVCVGQSAAGVIQLQGTTKIASHYRVISESVPKCCVITPMEGKVQGEDQVRQLHITTKTEFPTSILYIIYIIALTSTILIQFRSGRVFRVPFRVKFIIPDLFIEQNQFDFGRVTVQGNEGRLPMTIKNQSSVDSELIFDFSREQGFKVFAIKYAN